MIQQTWVGSGNVNWLKWTSAKPSFIFLQNYHSPKNFKRTIHSFVIALKTVGTTNSSMTVEWFSVEK